MWAIQSKGVCLCFLAFVCIKKKKLSFVYCRIRCDSSALQKDLAWENLIWEEREEIDRLTVVNHLTSK